MEIPPIIPEKINQASPIHFESGTHANTKNEVDALYNADDSGNLDRYTWNDEVGNRIASYAYNAPSLLLTIDGLMPKPPSKSDVFSNPHVEAVDIWSSLPARPNKLSHTGRVYILKGDSKILRLSQAVMPDVVEPASVKQEVVALDDRVGQNAVTTVENSIVEETVGIAGFGLALWGASKLLSSPHTISRRQFLSKSVAVAAGAITLGSLSRLEIPTLAADVPNEPTKDFLQTVENIIRPRINSATFIDGRTALLLAKAEDAQASLQEFAQATNVVVMGNAHGFMAPTYIQDKGERNKAIVTYVQELLDVAKQVYGNYYNLSPEQIPPQATNSLLNYVTQVDIVEITDPGAQSFQPSVAQTIDKQIIPYKSFNSPQVEEAIRDLRPKQ
jgi:hypothetical protein